MITRLIFVYQPSVSKFLCLLPIMKAPMIARLTTEVETSPSFCVALAYHRGRNFPFCVALAYQRGRNFPLLRLISLLMRVCYTVVETSHSSSALCLPSSKVETSQAGRTSKLPGLSVCYPALYVHLTLFFVSSAIKSYILMTLYI